VPPAEERLDTVLASGAAIAPANLDELERRDPESFRKSFKHLERRASLAALEHGDVADR
jgi:hypothetical protein